ncbi:MAG: hypothetical protein HWQ38_24120 [Nostoc sp. NMS7]|uniref:hypothetical protein n=1 Tax=Nostoc sp. NMS7 TaxID=2815391 RepID=UPI0025E6AC40|nr:hypothetical protein [Nostoc sp. NMS7]MBN3949380.1 hypothetical protein [Nostoc sp. NMS7]
MTKAQAYRDFTIQSFRFIAGLSNACPESERYTFKYFIDGRSRASELRQMKQYFRVINSKYTKRELIEFFCNLPAGDRKFLLEKIPDIITVLPSDCDNFKVERPRAIALRYANFGGKTVEYDVYAVVDFLKAVEQKMLLIKT